MRPQDSGQLYVTNKRLLFIGQNKSCNITTGRIVNADVFDDALQVHKSSGPAEIFLMSGAHAEYCYGLLAETQS